MGVMRAFRSEPRLFARMLASHVGGVSSLDLAASGLALGWRLLTASNMPGVRKNSVRPGILKRGWTTAAACLLWLTVSGGARAQQIVLQCDKAQTAADFTLGDVLHTVHGTFTVTRGTIQFDPASGTVAGEMVFDAASGQSGNRSRDRKMHKEVLESARYPEITFRPDRVEGTVTNPGTAKVQVHGRFGIHGAEHEITVPVEVKLDAGRWTATSQFPVPYAKWGMKNPSVLFLRVGDSVDIQFHGAGSVVPSQ